MKQDGGMTLPKAMGRYRSARFDLLLLVILTVFNVVLLVTQSDTMMLFSIFVPYIAVAIAVGSGITWFLQGSLILAFVIVALYLLCWFFSKRHYGWMIGGLVLLALDTLVVVIYYWGYWSYGWMDLLIHGILLIYLVRGAVAGRYLHSNPPQQAEPTPIRLENTPSICRAEDAQEAVVLAQAQTPVGVITYRAVGDVKELVINGFVYDRLELVVETAHQLQAVYDGHLVRAGLVAGSAVRYIDLDGYRIVQAL